MAEGNVATPFLDTRSFVREESEAFASELPTPAMGSPFLSLYELDGQSEYGDPEQEAWSTLVQELYDAEFDEALFELMTAARDLHQQHEASAGQGVDGERLLQQHFQQLIGEAENTVTSLERELGARDPGHLDEAELDALAERDTPSPNLSPEFEEFLGKWKKKLVGLAKKAGKLAVKLGLGPVLNKLKALIRPLLNKVLQMAIGKLPEAVRPAAEKLADRILNRRPKEAAPAASPSDPSSSGATATSPEDAAAATQAPAGASVTDLQQELNEQFANLLLASDEVDLELEVARVRSMERSSSTPVYSDLDQARERFIDELQELRDGEDAGPAIQNFLPAVLPALRLGIKLAGRGRVVGFLASLLAKLIGKLIGPEAAPALSRAIVDTGLKLLTLEVSPADQRGAAASAVAATVEETVRRISALPDHVLDNQELLEGFALEAFEQAAAANLPPILPESVYRDRPELLESRNAKTSWILLPLQRRKRYKKCGRTFKVRISPYVADEIESFEGPLSDYLYDQLGVEEGAEVEAEVSLYETLPGTTLPDIAHEESETSGTAGAVTATQLHPLTTKAAGLLLGEPRMGRNVPIGTGPQSIGVGQRLYHLSIPGKRLLTAPHSGRRARARRTGGIRLTLDGPNDTIRMHVFLSEVKAQKLAVRLRRQAHAGTVTAGFLRYLQRRLAPILRGERLPGIRVIQPGLASRAALGAALQRLPRDVSQAMTQRLQEAAVSAFAELAKAEGPRFITAAEEPADGVTLTFHMARFAGLQQFGKALLADGSTNGLAAAIAGGNKPDVRIDVTAGYKND
ncbi:MAG: hypothetical protein ABI779_15225 [Acidobacteriota bacterium]